MANYFCYEKQPYGKWAAAIYYGAAPTVKDGRVRLNGSQGPEIRQLTKLLDDDPLSLTLLKKIYPLREETA